jgi:hypothetical protein
MAPATMRKLHPRDTRRAVVPLFGILFVLVAAACNEGNGATPCLPEDVEPCTCADGRSGFEVCPADGGQDYTACNCDLDASPYLPVPSEEAGADAAEDHAVEAEAASGLQFMSPCSTQPGSPPCPAGDTCYDFPAKGQFCSHSCTEATDCPPPSSGCNGMGECKAP